MQIEVEIGQADPAHVMTRVDTEQVHVGLQWRRWCGGTEPEPGDRFTDEASC